MRTWLVVFMKPKDNRSGPAQVLSSTAARLLAAPKSPAHHRDYYAQARGLPMPAMPFRRAMSAGASATPRGPWLCGDAGDEKGAESSSAAATSTSNGCDWRGDRIGEWEGEIYSTTAARPSLWTQVYPSARHVAMAVCLL